MYIYLNKMYSFLNLRAYTVSTDLVRIIQVITQLDEQNLFSPCLLDKCSS